MGKSKRVHLWVFMFILAWSERGVLSAAPLRTMTRDLSGPAGKVSKPLPDLSRKLWWLFLGIDGGGINYSSVNPAVEGARSGFSLGARALITRHFTDFTLDGGLGWKLISAKGNNPATSLQAATVDTISTKLPYIDLSLRYRIGPKFQIGPEFEWWLGTDNGLNEYIASPDTNNGKFIGLEAVYEWAKYRKYRWGGRMLMSLGVPSRTVVQYGLFYQVGFDAFDTTEAPPLERRAPPRTQGRPVEQMTPEDLEKAESLVPSEPVPMESPSADQGYVEPAPDVMSTPTPPGEAPPVTEATAPAAAPMAAPVSSGDGKLVLTMGFNDLPFGSNNVELPLAHRARAKKIGKYLAAHQSAWKRVVISGHTDERGAAKFNVELSLRRAEVVKRIFEEGGVAEGRMKTIGYGESKPVDRGHDEKAWSKNRRVELEFSGVSDAEAVKHALDH